MAIFNWIQEKIIKQYAGNIVRHGLTTLAGVLAAAAFPGAEELGKLLTDNLDPLTSALTALAVFLIGMLLSVRNGRK